MVWMVKDKQHNQNQKPLAAPPTLKSFGLVDSNSMQYLVLKVQKSTKHYTEAAIDEIELLNCIAKEWIRCESLKKSMSAPHAVTSITRGWGAYPRA